MERVKPISQARQAVEPSPGHGLNLLALDMLRRLYPNEEIPKAIGDRLKTLQEELRQPIHHGRDVRRASKREYDRWTQEIFRSVVDGVRGEVLVGDFLARLQSLIDEGKSEALFALVVEVSVADETGGQQHSRLVGHCGVPHADHWKHFDESLSVGKSRVANSNFWKGLLAESEGKELLLSRYWPDYAGELDGLFLASVRARASPARWGFWFSTVSLRSSDPSQPQRVLLVAYESLGTTEFPRPAEGAVMEWRVLFFLYIAYQTADYGTQNIHKEVAEQRERLIQSLAPGIMAHELAGGLRAMHNNTVLMATTLNDCLQYVQSSPRLDQRGLQGLGQWHADIGDHLLRLAQHCNEMLTSASAFLNLDRAHGIERFSVTSVIGEALVLCRNRLARVAEVEIRGRTDLEIESDRALLMVVILNVLSNAAKAIAKAEHDDPRSRNRVVLRISTSESAAVLEPGSQVSGPWFQILIANDGPPIEPGWDGLIFLRGRTTDPEGFGQGLFLCRRLCRHLHGNIYLASDEDIKPLSMKVGFTIDLPVSQPQQRIGKKQGRH